MPAHLADHASPIHVTREGKALFISQGDVPLRVDRIDPATGRVTPLTALRPDDLTGVVGINGPWMTPDGEAYASGYSRFLMNLYLLEGLRW